MANDGISGAMGSEFPSLQRAAEEWKYVDDFTVWEVGFLWGGHEPIKKIYRHHTNIPPPYHAIVRMLLGSIRSGNLPAKTKFINGPVDEDSQVSRAALIKLCEQKQEFPPFLFDTMPGTSEQTEETGLSEIPDFSPKSTGRPAEYPWNKFMAALILIEGLEGLPNGKMNICKRLLEFIRDGNLSDKRSDIPKTPDISVVQKHLGVIIDAFMDLREITNSKKRQ